ncbi:MAG: hypothetical protein IJ019_04910 [Alphaproteobacteria bacterium]|nr:hypothetical protein [Alphaproteobacteria bacterium]
MVNKLIVKAGKYAAKKLGNKALEKAFEPYEKINKTAYGIRPLNIGERETIECLQNPRNSLDYCKSVGNKVRKKYHKNK